MSAVLSFLLFAISNTLTSSRELPTISSLYREIVVREKAVIPSQPAVTESGSIIYAICNRTDYHFSTNKYCNVTVERSHFSGSPRVNSCLVRVAPDEAYFQTLSRFTMLTFTDNKLIFFWEQEDERFSTKSIVFRILKLPKCELINVTIPTDQLSYVVVYKNNFDLILSDKKYCGSPSCKITLDEGGRRVHLDPIKILTDIDVAFQSGLGAVVPRSPHKGFYSSVAVSGERNVGKSYEHLLRVDRDGRAVAFDKIFTDSHVSFSNSHEYFSLCERTEATAIYCRQYDATLTLKINETFELQGAAGLNRWMQPYNFEDGSLLLVVGVTADVEGRHYNNFEAIKVDPDGHRDRALVVEGLDLKCKRSEVLRVYTIENELDDVCFYFVCRQGDEYRRKLKFSVKCLPITIFTMVRRRPAIVS